MPRLFRNMLIATGLLSALSLTLLGVLTYLGARIDQEHVATYSQDFALSPEEIWYFIADFPSQADWNEAIVLVEELALFEGNPVWRETYSTGDSMTFYVSNVEVGRRLHRTIHKPDSPFQGHWEIEIIPSNGNQSQLVVTEFGKIRHPILRFLAHRIMGVDTFVKTYVENIAAASEPPHEL